MGPQEPERPADRPDESQNQDEFEKGHGGMGNLLSLVRSLTARFCFTIPPASAYLLIVAKQSPGMRPEIRRPA